MDGAILAHLAFAAAIPVDEPSCGHNLASGDFSLIKVPNVLILFAGGKPERSYCKNTKVNVTHFCVLPGSVMASKRNL